MAVVVDTDVISFDFKRDSRAERYERYLVGQVVVISFMTLAELYEWAEGKRWGWRRRQRLEEHIADYVVRYADPELCRLWAAVRAEAERKAKPIGVADAWHAATALKLGLDLVTHNGADFEGVEGLRVITHPD